MWWVSPEKNWKTYIKSYNWLQTYAYLFGVFNHDNAIRLHTKMNSDLGVSLNFMAVSIGYTWNVNRWMSNVRDDRSSLISRSHARCFPPS